MIFGVFAGEMFRGLDMFHHSLRSPWDNFCPAYFSTNKFWPRWSCGNLVSRKNAWGSRAGPFLRGENLLFGSSSPAIWDPWNPMRQCGNVPWVVIIWVFPKIGVPQNGWFIMEIPIKMIQNWWFGGTTIFGNTHMFGCEGNHADIWSSVMNKIAVIINTVGGLLDHAGWVFFTFQSRVENKTRQIQQNSFSSLVASPFFYKGFRRIYPLEN